MLWGVYSAIYGEVNVSVEKCVGVYSAIYGEVNVSVEKCVEIKGDYVEK